MNAQQDTMRVTFTSDGRGASYVAPAGLALAVLAGMAAALAGFGTRWGWWYFMTGFIILRWAAIGGLAAAAISLAGGIAVMRPELIGPDLFLPWQG